MRRRYAMTLGIVVVLVVLGLWFRDWYPGSQLDDRPICGSLTRTSDCWNGPWP